VAMDKRNITLALPKDVLKRVKIMAAEQGISVSALMERLLQEQLARHEGYEQARQRQAGTLAEGLDLGTGGQRRWTREELHERA
jgi:metal-responsive CopG/Arc/MetJ family transcriptional regulator